MDYLIKQLREVYVNDNLWDMCRAAADKLEYLQYKIDHLEAEVIRLERMSNG